MTKFEAETDRHYFHSNSQFKTTKERIAYYINSNWIYSAHWKDETWVEQAKEDCLTRIDQVQKELNELKLAMIIIENIDE